MKILHISHGGLPDPRIERTAITMKKRGHEMSFLGGGAVRWMDMDAFSETSSMPLGNSLEIVFKSSIKERWMKKIDEFKPDIIHAHNVIVAHFLLGSDYAVVYDDHEYWSKQVFKFKVRGLKSRLFTLPLQRAIPKWERDLIESYPVITTTENTAVEHRERSKYVGVTKNVPLLREVDWLGNPSERNGIVYIGTDFKLDKFLPHRDMSGLKDIISLDVVHGLTHDEMMERLTHYEIGTTPWKKHPWHPYSEANKNYEYMHAGLQVVVNSILKEPFADDPYVHSFEDYTEIKGVFDSIPHRDPEEIMKHARENYVWDNQEAMITDAYKIA